MNANNHKTALVTGANAGLGFEAAAQLADLGYSRIVLACRTLEKANAARAHLLERTGRDPFQAVAMDVGKNDTVRAAVAELTQHGGTFDFVLLNAGMVAGSEIVHTEDRVEMTVAASLIGHHVLATGMLDADLLATNARIVIAGSEAARGDVPMMAHIDVPAFAQEHFEGDRSQAIQAIARAEAPYVYKNMPHYAMTKLFVAWWASALARRLPAGMTVTAVSPGSAPGTSVMRNQPAFMKAIMTVMMVWIGPFIGMAAPTDKAARRYIDAASYGEDANGQFFASKPGKMVGPVVRQTQPHVLDHASQEACWDAVVQLSGGVTLRQPAMKDVV